MPDARPPKAETRTYAVARLRNRSFPGFLAWGGFLLLVEALPVLLAHGQPVNVGLILQRLQDTFWVLAVIGIFGYYVFSKANDRLPDRIEMGPDGIARVERSGARVFIAWDEIEEVVQGTGLRKLGVKAPAAGKWIYIPGHMDWIKEVVQRVLEEYRKRNPEVEGDTYRPTSEGKAEYWVAGGFFVLFALAAMGFFAVEVLNGGFATEKNPKSAIFTCVLSALVILPLGMYFIRAGLAFCRKRLVVNVEGITQIDGDVSRVFIAWNDIRRLRQVGFMSSDFAVAASGTRDIRIYSGYGNQAELTERIGGEFMSRLTMPPLPAVVGRTGYFRRISVLAAIVLVCGFMTWLFLFRSDLTDPQNMVAGCLVIALFWGFWGWAGFVNFRRIEKATLDSRGLFLHRLRGQVFLRWEDLAGVEWFVPGSSSVEVPYSLLMLTDRRGRCYKIRGSLDFRLRLYTYLTNRLPKTG